MLENIERPVMRIARFRSALMGWADEVNKADPLVTTGSGLNAKAELNC